MVDFGQILFPVAGAAIGGAATMSPQGALVGMSVGQAIGTGLNQPDAPNFQGPTAAQLSIQQAQLANIERTQAQQGLSAADVARINQVINATTEQQLASIQALPQTLTPLERQRLTKALMTQARATTASVEQRIAALDPAAEARRLSAISQATGVAASNAAAIQQAQLREQQLALQLEQQRAQAFNQSMQNIVRAIDIAGKMPAKKQDTTSGLVVGNEPTPRQSGAVGRALLKSASEQPQPATSTIGEPIPIKTDEELLNQFGLGAMGGALT